MLNLMQGGHPMDMITCFVILCGLFFMVPVGFVFIDFYLDFLEGILSKVKNYMWAKRSVKQL
jgi:hypothetical protein